MELQQPKHQERNLSNDSPWRRNPCKPQTVKPTREQTFKRPNTCLALSPPPARPPLVKAPGAHCHCPSHADLPTGSSTPRVLREYGMICLNLFFFLTTPMWEESWEEYEHLRFCNTDLREACRKFPRSVTVVIVCKHSVLTPRMNAPPENSSAGGHGLKV